MRFLQNYYNKRDFRLRENLNIIFHYEKYNKRYLFFIILIKYLFKKLRKSKVVTQNNTEHSKKKLI